MEKASKLWVEDDGGMDELQAVLGYKVKSLDMEEVAQQLDQYEGDFQLSKTNLSPLASDTPSDLSTWLKSLLKELNPPPIFDFVMAAPPPSLPSSPSADDSFMAPAKSSTMPIVLVDLQENGIQLIHTLMAWREAVHVRESPSDDATS